jgi:cytidyltransferase-like protein
MHTIQTITNLAKKLRDNNQKLVLATGFFDLLHSEHLGFLKAAKATGDVLIVAVESDLRAKKIKGKSRPIQTQLLRCQNLLQTGIVDYVIALPDDFDNPQAYESLLTAVYPHIYAVSSHTTHQQTKSVLTAKHGAKLVVVYSHNPKVSTTQIINSQNQL